MTESNWRELCAELTGWIERSTRHYVRDPDVLTRARAALAQPEPTDEEIESFLLDVAAERGDIYWAEPLVLARAVLARWGRPASANGPAVPDDRESASVTTDAINRAPSLTDIAMSMLGTIERMGLIIPEITDTIRKALELGWAAPPAEGEVAAVVKWLRMFATGEFGSDSSHPDARQLRCAADLLEHQAAPVPVAVNERLPGPEDLDDQRRCWWLAPETDTKCGCWCLGPGTCLPPEGFGETHWLPASALPLPAGEVQP